MQARRLVMHELLGLVICVANLATTERLLATNFVWNKPFGCGLFSCDYFDANHWSPGGGPPGTGDFATIDMTGTVHLTQSTEVLDSLTLFTSTTFRTFGNRLWVFGSPGNLFLFGSGFTGSTTLRVDSGGGFQLIANTISLHQGSELFLAGGNVRADFRMLISQSSLISGNGTIALTGDELGSTIELAGTLRPSNGDIAIVADSFHDLDGNVAGVEPGFLDLTSTGSLFVNGEQWDPFSGRLDIGNSRQLNLSSPWSMDGELNFTTTGSNRLVGPMFYFLPGAQVTTNQSAGRIEGESLWSDGTSLSLTNAADSLSLSGDSVIESGVNFSGDGRITNTVGSVMSLLDGAIVGVELLNQGTVEVGASAGRATIGDFAQASGGTLEIELGGTGAGEFDSLHVLGDGQFTGNLNVTLLSGFTLETQQQFKILEVDGVASGQFAGLAEGAAIGTPGETLFISYAGGDGNDVVLHTVGFAGDFNFDGDVDGFDFLMWQRGFGSIYNGNDLTDWEANFGMVAPLSATSAAVPEPASMLLMLAATQFLCLRITRRGDRSRQLDGA